MYLLEKNLPHLHHFVHIQEHLPQLPLNWWVARSLHHLHVLKHGRTISAFSPWLLACYLSYAVPRSDGTVLILGLSDDGYSCDDDDDTTIYGSLSVYLDRLWVSSLIRVVTHFLWIVYS